MSKLTKFLQLIVLLRKKQTRVWDKNYRRRAWKQFGMTKIAFLYLQNLRNILFFLGVDSNTHRGVTNLSLPKNFLHSLNGKELHNWDHSAQIPSVRPCRPPRKETPHFPMGSYKALWEVLRIIQNTSPNLTYISFHLGLLGNFLKIDQSLYNENLATPLNPIRAEYVF